MNSQMTGLRVASAVFAIMCVAQLLRVALRPEVVVAGHLVPLWPSIIAVALLAALSVWLWRLTGSGTPPRLSS